MYPSSKNCVPNRSASRQTLHTTTSNLDAGAAVGVVAPRVYLVPVQFARLQYPLFHHCSFPIFVAHPHNNSPLPTHRFRNPLISVHYTRVYKFMPVHKLTAPHFRHRQNRPHSRSPPPGRRSSPRYCTSIWPRRTPPNTIPRNLWTQGPSRQEWICWEGCLWFISHSILYTGSRSSLNP